MSRGPAGRSGQVARWCLPECDSRAIAGELPRTNHFGFRLADEAAVRAARDRFGPAGLVETEWQDDGRFVRVQVADPDGYSVEVYAHH